MPLRRLPPISSAEPSTPPAMGVASLEEVKDKKNSLEKSWQDSKQVRNSGLIDWESYECLLVTPLFGGGVVAGQVDQAHAHSRQRHSRPAALLVATAGQQTAEQS